MMLAQLQAEFWSAVAEGRNTIDSDSVFVGSPELGADDRLAIYADMYRARCVECLRDDFPKLAALLTHEAFCELTAEYVARHPSRDPSLSSLGRDLGSFLAGRPAERPDLSDLAALEWARAEVFEEADSALLSSPSELSGPLQLILALRRLRLQWNVSALWAALEADEPVPEPSPGPIDVIVWRKELALFHVVVPEDEARAIAHAAARESLAQICAAFEAREDALASAVRALGSWFAEGWVSDPTTRKTT